MKKVTLELWYDEGYSTMVLKESIEEMKLGRIDDDWVYLKGKVEEGVSEPAEANAISS